MRASNIGKWLCVKLAGLWRTGIDSLRLAGGWATAKAELTGQRFGEGLIREKSLARCSVRRGRLAGNCGICALLLQHMELDGCGAGRMRYRIGASRFNGEYMGVHGMDSSNASHTVAVVLILMHLADWRVG